MTKMAATPIYGKNLKNILLQNRRSYDPETWHAESGFQILLSLFWLCFKEKVKTMDF